MLSEKIDFQIDGIRWVSPSEIGEVISGKDNGRHRVRLTACRPLCSEDFGKNAAYAVPNASGPSSEAEIDPTTASPIRPGWVPLEFGGGIFEASFEIRPDDKQGRLVVFLGLFFFSALQASASCPAAKTRLTTARPLTTTSISRPFGTKRIRHSAREPSLLRKVQSIDGFSTGMATSLWDVLEVAP